MTDELDGVIVDPEHHQVLFENDAVRVIEVTIRAGDITPLHTHLRPTLNYVVSGSHLIRRDGHGTVLVDTRTDPDYVMPRVTYGATSPLHTIENPGPADLDIIAVELKAPPAAINRSRVSDQPTTRQRKRSYLRTPYV